MEQNTEELEQLRLTNGQLLEKLQSITNEFAVMKSDAEIVKQKARQMLIQKDEELERMRANKGGQQANGQNASNATFSRNEDQPESGDSGSFVSDSMLETVTEADNSQALNKSVAEAEVSILIYHNESMIKA